GFLPPSELNRLRRDALAALVDGRRSSAPARTALEPTTPRDEIPRRVGTRLAVSISSEEAARRALAAGADLIYLDVGEHVRALAAATRLEPLARLAAEAAPGRTWLKTPLVTHPAMVRRYLSVLPSAGIVASNLGVLREARERGRLAVADHPTNAYNTRTIEALAALGAERVTLSLEIHSGEAVSLGER